VEKITAGELNISFSSIKDPRFPVTKVFIFYVVTVGASERNSNRRVFVGY
jgi:hypothetical protein